MAAAYRFGELGWLLFVRLCQELLHAEAGITRNCWIGDPSSGYSAVLPEGLPAQGVAAPATAVALWVAPGQLLPIDTLQSRLSEDGGDALLFLTNASADHFRRVLGDLAAARGISMPRVYGPPELAERLDASPALRRRVPFVLGVSDLDQLVDQEAAQRSTADLAAARALAPVFVPTRAYETTVEVLDRYQFAVLTGPPEMGKTAIARMISLAALTEGWEAHECVRPEELWAVFDRDRRQVFVADDAFGSTEYRPEAAERWALELDRVLRATDERHRLIWTSRPAPLTEGLRRIHREHGVERFPQPAQVQVHAADLDVAEKTLILFRHAQAANLPPDGVSLVRRQGWEIVSNSHFTPERIRRFATHRLRELIGPERPFGSRDVAAAVAAEIREPTEAMSTSLRALGPEHRGLLVAMLDAPPGPVPERELAAAVRRHSDVALPRPPAELVDRLTDHFVRVVPPTSVTWVHPSWRDLVIDELRGSDSARLSFLERCSVHGLVLALSIGGGPQGERVLPLLVDDSDWDAATDRLHSLAPELDDNDVVRLLGAITEAAVEAVQDSWRRAELDAFATAALALTGSERVFTAGVLTSWFALARRVQAAPPAPDVGATWVELLPTSPIDIMSPEEVNRAVDWLDLVSLLREHAPEALERLRWDERNSGVFRRLVTDTFQALELGVEIPTAHRLADLLRLSGHPRSGALARRRVPRDEHEEEPGARVPPRPYEPDDSRRFVESVLGDLRPGG